MKLPIAITVQHKVVDNTSRSYKLMTAKVAAYYTSSFTEMDIPHFADEETLIKNQLAQSLVYKLFEDHNHNLLQLKYDIIAIIETSVIPYYMRDDIIRILNERIPDIIIEAEIIT